MLKIRKYIEEVIAELKKVQWPSKEEAKNLTLYVIGVSLGVGAIVATLDYIFKKVLSYFIFI